ncbi:guanyl-specific ribonuclease [Ophiocordyceps camponoti-floridani]|uniref:Guanyl-specific ribonuclease n=1 Tax=Ophiocordyceps camponoti-floridani TaxID=2030778 RepID=A0A8H4Q3B2_9HYPO|nr:guanyl-specific ribonuclease [Ophiocordyceps camponoti-floridani]
MRFAALLTLATTLLTPLTLALPSESSGQLQASPADLSALAAKLKLKVNRKPGKGSTCPETKNPRRKPHSKRLYTDNQITKAFMVGATYAANDRQVGEEGLKFPCGKNLMEFPIQEDNQEFKRGGTDEIPDRVVFEYTKNKKEFIVKYCGVMRHGPGKDFLLCPE